MKKPPRKRRGPLNAREQNRTASFVIITAINIVGMAVYRALSLDWWLDLLLPIKK